MKRSVCYVVYFLLALFLFQNVQAEEPAAEPENKYSHLEDNLKAETGVAISHLADYFAKKYGSPDNIPLPLSSFVNLVSERKYDEAYLKIKEIITHPIRDEFSKTPKYYGYTLIDSLGTFAPQFIALMIYQAKDEVFCMEFLSKIIKRGLADLIVSGDRKHVENDLFGNILATPLYSSLIQILFYLPRNELSEKSNSIIDNTFGKLDFSQKTEIIKEMDWDENNEDSKNAKLTIENGRFLKQKTRLNEIYILWRDHWSFSTGAERISALRELIKSSSLLTPISEATAMVEFSRRLNVDNSIANAELAYNLLQLSDVELRRFLSIHVISSLDLHWLNSSIVASAKLAGYASLEKDSVFGRQAKHDDYQDNITDPKGGYPGEAVKYLINIVSENNNFRSGRAIQVGANISANKNDILVKDKNLSISELNTQLDSISLSVVERERIRRVISEYIEIISDKK